MQRKVRKKDIKRRREENIKNLWPNQKKDQRKKMKKNQMKKKEKEKRMMERKRKRVQTNMQIGGKMIPTQKKINKLLIVLLIILKTAMYTKI